MKTVKQRETEGNTEYGWFYDTEEKKYNYYILENEFPSRTVTFKCVLDMIKIGQANSVLVPTPVVQDCLDRYEEAQETKKDIEEILSRFSYKGKGNK